MRHLLLAVMLFAACTPEIPEVAETSGAEAAAGSNAVGVKSEALLATPCSDFQWVARVEKSLENAYSCQHSKWINPGDNTLLNNYCRRPGNPTQFMSLWSGFNVTNADPNICQVTTRRRINGGSGQYCDWLRHHCIIEPWSTTCSAVQINACN